MNLKERMVAALERKIPDQVPHFELDFQIEKEMFGQCFDLSKFEPAAFGTLNAGEKDSLLHAYAEHLIDLYMNKLEYSSLPVPRTVNFETDLELIKIMRKIVGETMMLHYHGDGTYALPDGNQMYDFAYRIADDPEGLITQAEDMANHAIEANKKLAAAGIDLFILCSDYCYNSGPFISPPMFAEFITPFLAKIIESIRKDGCYAVKHTDGNIMPILDQLVEANPHAIHSLDPMAGVDIAVVKKEVGDKVALCGNVNCALLQTGTEAEIIESAEYAMKHGKPGGGYVYCTSNVPFKGLNPDRYQIVLDVWKRLRAY